jgi:hypothetical protein
MVDRGGEAAAGEHHSGGADNARPGDVTPLFGQR